jgi:hypothetical protein
LYVPETKGRSLEQLDDLFEQGVAARKFSSFVVERQLVDDLVDINDAKGNQDVERHDAAIGPIQESGKKQ